MPLDAKLRKRIERSLAAADDRGPAGPRPDGGAAAGRRLVGDARRLWARVRTLLALGLVPDGVELDALELAAYALQLPHRRVKTLPTGKPGRSTLRDRAEEAAELLIAEAAAHADELLLDRTARVLHEMPHRSPMLDESRVLADAVSLEDFGVVGLVQLTIQLARHGDGVAEVADGLEKREQYGYWDARLKDGFHFDAARQMARRRLDHARKVAALLKAELAEDGG